MRHWMESTRQPHSAKHCCSTTTRHSIIRTRRGGGSCRQQWADRMDLGRNLTMDNAFPCAPCLDAHYTSDLSMWETTTKTAARVLWATYTIMLRRGLAECKTKTLPQWLEHLCINSLSYNRPIALLQFCSFTTSYNGLCPYSKPSKFCGSIKPSSL